MRNNLNIGMAVVSAIVASCGLSMASEPGKHFSSDHNFHHGEAAILKEKGTFSQARHNFNLAHGTIKRAQAKNSASAESKRANQSNSEHQSRSKGKMKPTGPGDKSGVNWDD
ncbi:MAG: hypothetical protein Q8K36_06515 [Alphaproteobacteria bacterium]|nr:hypothetical protein [Alphaproteobacteria bacterium]